MVDARVDGAQVLALAVRAQRLAEQVGADAAVLRALGGVVWTGPAARACAAALEDAATRARAAERALDAGGDALRRHAAAVERAQEPWGAAGARRGAGALWW